MGMFSDLREECDGDRDRGFWQIWIEAVALWCFVTLCLVVVTIGGIVDAATWVFTLPARRKRKP